MLARLLVRLTSDDVQRVANVLDDTIESPQTRDRLVRRASAGLVGVGGLGLLAGCGDDESGDGEAGGTRTGAAGGTGTTTAAMTDDQVTQLLNTAVTAEALAVTYLTGLVQKAQQAEVADFADVLKAANAAELQHYRYLQEIGAEPITRRFWVPDSFFEPGNVFPTIETLEEVFINAYVVAAAVFTQANMAESARVAGQIAGVEAEHRTLARFAQDKLPDNLAFEDASLETVDAHVQAITDAGIGLGEEGATPGMFYEFSEPPASALVDLENTSPQ